MSKPVAKWGYQLWVPKVPAFPKSTARRIAEELAITAPQALDVLHKGLQAATFHYFVALHYQHEPTAGEVHSALQSLEVAWTQARQLIANADNWTNLEIRLAYRLGRFDPDTPDERAHALFEDDLAHVDRLLNALRLANEHAVIRKASSVRRGSPEREMLRSLIETHRLLTSEKFRQGTSGGYRGSMVRFVTRCTAHKPLLIRWTSKGSIYKGLSRAREDMDK